MGAVLCGCTFDLRVPALGGADRCGSIMVTEPPVVGESRCLKLPRIASGVLGPSSCDSLHRPGYRVLRPSPYQGEREEANPTGSETARSDGDQSP